MLTQGFGRREPCNSPINLGMLQLAYDLVVYAYIPVLMIYFIDDTCICLGNVWYVYNLCTQNYCEHMRHCPNKSKINLERRGPKRWQSLDFRLVSCNWFWQRLILCCGVILGRSCPFVKIQQTWSWHLMSLCWHGQTVIPEVYLDILGPGVKLESFAPHEFAPKCANGRAKSRSRLFRNGICQNLDCRKYKLIHTDTISNRILWAVAGCMSIHVIWNGGYLPCSFVQSIALCSCALIHDTAIVTKYGEDIDLSSILPLPRTNLPMPLAQQIKHGFRTASLPSSQLASFPCINPPLILRL